MKSIFMLLNLSKVALFALLSVLITLFLIMTIALFTHSGNVYLLKVGQRIEPRLKIELVQGTFTRKPTYEVIQWQDEQTNINLNNVSYQFKWSCLLSKVCLQNLTVGSGDINIQSQTQETTESQSSEPLTSLPIAFAIDNIDLNNINFDVNGIKGTLGYLQFAALGKNQDLEISANIDNLTVDLPISDTQKPAVSRTKSTLNLSEPLISKENLPDVILPFNIKIKPLSVTNLNITQDNTTLFTLNDFSTDTTFNQSLLTVNNLSLDLPETNLALSGNVNLTDNYPLDVQLQGKLKKISQLQPTNLIENQHYKLSMSGNLSDLNIQLNLSNKVNVKVSSNAKLMTKNTPYSLDVNWQKLRWPLNGEVQYSSQQGHLKSVGTLNDYLINLQTDYLIKGIPAGELSLQGKGDLVHFNIAPVTVNTLDGNVKLTGNLSWKDAIRWAGDLNLDRIDLAQLDTGYSGNISGNINQTFTLTTPKNKPSTWAFTVPQMNINGQVLDHDFEIAGVVSGDSKKGVHFDNVSVKNADNDLIINGAYSKSSDLDIKLNINDLGDAIPNATGSVKGTINIQGETEALSILTNLAGNNLNYQSNNLESFNLQGDVKLSQFPAANLTLQASDANLNGNIIDSVQLTVKNINSVVQSQSHQIELAVKAPKNSADFDITINQNKTGWSSKLTEGRIQLVDYLLTLNKVVTVTPDDKNILVSSHCWDITHSKIKEVAQICSGDLNIGEQGYADLTLTDFPLATMNDFINEPLTLNGNLNADVKLKWIDLANPQFDIKIDSQQLSLNIDQDDRVTTYPVDTLNITLINTGTTSDINAVISSPKLVSTKITGQLSENKTDVTASLNISVPDLSPLKDLSTQLEKLAGALEANISVNGTINKPIINGQVDITNTTVYAVGSPIKVNDLNTNVKIDNNNAIIEGSFYTEEYNDYTASKTLLTNTVNFIDNSVHIVGNALSNNKANIPSGNKAIISGNLNWEKALKGNIALTADKITINDYDKINLQVSPDLKLAFGDAIILTGNILVDKGLISVNELADSGVAISKDVVIIDNDTVGEEKSLPIIIDLNVDLGSQLQVKAMGLDSIISGDLQIKQPKDKSTSVYGTLILSDGTYTVLSQKLTLEDSEIIFQGPTETPYISIDAIRDTDNTEDDVTAGVKVTGTPDNLDISIYSDPEMSQQEALSYLIQGQSLSNSSDSDSQITNMLMILQMSAANSFGVLNTVGNKLGIENLSVSSSGTGDEQSVGLSGYIAPKVQISYGVGVFDNFAKFAIRYEVFENFFLEASTGLTQAIDAYYQFDVD